MEKVISETIFAIKEADEAFAVIIGATGSGKTLSLRMIIDSLGSDKYKVVIVTNPGISFIQLLMEIIGQISGNPCEEGRKNVLLDKFRRLLFSTISEGKKVAIFIDEANTLTPANLENLRLLTNIQDENRNLFTLVLVGQIELAERLEHPKRANLFQRIGTYGRIDKLPSKETMRAYIEARLKLAGTEIKIFSDDCIPILWEYSEYGVPRLINKICKLCLKAGEINKLDYISADWVLEVSERFQKLSKTAVQKRKPRSRPDDEEISDVTIRVGEVEESFSDEAFSDEDTSKEPTEQILPTISLSESQASSASAQISVTDSIITAESTSDAPQPTPIAVMQQEPGDTFIPETISPDNTTQTMTIEPLMQEILLQEGGIPVAANLPVLEEVAKDSPQENALPAAAAAVATESKPPDTSLSDNLTPAETLNEVFTPSVTETSGTEMKQDNPKAKDLHEIEHENGDEITIGEHKIHLAIPKDILKQVRTFNPESVNKSAGFWAAQIIKKNPKLTSSPLADPVHVWNEIKDSILKKIAV